MYLSEMTLVQRQYRNRMTQENIEQIRRHITLAKSALEEMGPYFPSNPRNEIAGRYWVDRLDRNLTSARRVLVKLRDAALGNLCNHDLHPMTTHANTKMVCRRCKQLFRPRLP